MEKFECFYQSLDRKGVNLSAEARPDRAVAPTTALPSSIQAPVTIRLGMTPEQVEAAVGSRPQKIIDLGRKKIFVFPDMKISLEDGKVSDVQ